MHTIGGTAVPVVNLSDRGTMKFNWGRRGKKCDSSKEIRFPSRTFFPEAVETITFIVV
jgi:hypothetical protein